MNIVIRHKMGVESLRKQPDLISRFGIVSKEINNILNRHGYEMINTAPEGTSYFEMGYVDISTGDLYEDPKTFPLELQFGLKEVDSLDIEIDDEEVIRSEYKDFDLDTEYHYQTFGWAEELLSMWRLAARSGNISLKQIRVAINSVANVIHGAAIQVIREYSTNPRLESVPVKSIEDFLATCETLDDEGVEVINLAISKPLPPPP